MLQSEQRRLAVEHADVVRRAGFVDLGDQGYDPEYGARPLKRVIQKRIQNLLADSILRGTLSSGSRASIDWRAGSFQLTSSRPEPATAS